MAKYLYAAFGLLIETNRIVPGLLAIEDFVPVETHIKCELFGDASEKLPSGKQQERFTSAATGIDGRPILVVWEIDGGLYYRFRYDDGTEFVVDKEGARIWGSWPSHLTIEDTAPFITGPVLGFALRRRMVVCLHASVVLLAPGRAIAFVGHAKAGKSTIAATFAQLGYPVLADDIAALQEDKVGFQVLPAHPTLRLWDSSVRELFGSETFLPRIAPDDPLWTKRYLQLGSNEYAFWDQAEQLAAIYVLEGRDVDLTKPFISTSTQKDDLVALIQNTYMNYLLGKEARAHEFDVLSRLLLNVPVRRITAPDDISSVRLVCASVLSDFESVKSSVMSDSLTG